MSIKFMKINKYEPAADEKRLEEMAAKGEFITGYFEGIATFKKGEPQKLRYCIELDPKMLNRDKLNMYAESGWKFVAGYYSDVRIYVTEDENAPAIHTDKSEYAHIVKRYHRSLVAILTMIYIIWGFMNIWETVISYAIMKRFVTVLAQESFYENGKLWLGMTIAAFFVCLFLLLIYIREIKASSKYVSSYIQNEKEAEKVIRRNKFVACLVTIVFIVLTVSGVFFAYAVNSAGEEKVNYSDITSKIITIDELFPEGKCVETEYEEELKEYLNPKEYENQEKFGHAFANSYTSCVTDSFYDYTVWGAYLPDNSEYGEKLLLHGYHYNFKAEWLAEIALTEEVNYQLNWLNNTLVDEYPDNIEAVSLDVSDSEFDEAIYVNDVYRDNFALVMRSGETVCRIDLYHDNENGITPEMIFENLTENVKE